MAPKATICIICCPLRHPGLPDSLPRSAEATRDAVPAMLEFCLKLTFRPYRAMRHHPPRLPGNLFQRTFSVRLHPSFTYQRRSSWEKPRAFRPCQAMRRHQRRLSELVNGNGENLYRLDLPTPFLMGAASRFPAMSGQATPSTGVPVLIGAAEAKPTRKRMLTRDFIMP